VKAAGAAVASRSITPPSNEEAAKSFLDDLVRRGRLKVEGIPRTRALVSRPHAPETHETYTHELRREGRAVVLRRVRIDCVSCPDPVA